METAAHAGDKDAVRVLKLRRDANFTLATILWGNVAVGVLLTLLADSILAATSAFIFSTLIFTMMWRPEVLMILMLIAVYGIIGEVSNPGAIIPGVVGVIALIIALYMSAVLPVNIAGIALIVLAAGLFIADAFTPSHGVLTGGAVTSLLFGLFLLFDRTDPVFQTAEKLVQAAAMISAQPIALQLRFLQTMSEIASENNTTTFLPLPLELFTLFLKQAADTGAAKG